MTGRIDLNTTPFKQLNMVVNQIEELKNTPPQSSEETSICHSLVDTVMCLANLAGHINKTVCQDFLDTLSEALRNIKKVRSFSNRENANSILENLDIHVTQTYIKTMELEADVFSKNPKDPLKNLSVQYQGIELIRHFSQDQRLQQMLSIAEEKIVEVQQIATFLESQKDSLANSKTNPKSKACKELEETNKAQFATTNLFFCKYNKLYKNEDYKSKASTAIVLEFIQQKLLGVSKPYLDEALLKGQIATARFLRDNPQNNKHFNVHLADLTKTQEFAQLQKLRIETNEGEKSPLGFNFLEGINRLPLVFETMKKLLNEQKEDSLGFILATRGERLGIILEKTETQVPTITVFDPYGSFRLRGDYWAYSIVCESFNILSDFLTTRFPIEMSFANSNFHSASIIPLKINPELKLASKTIPVQKAAAVENIAPPAAVENIIPPKEFSSPGPLATCQSLLTALDKAESKDALDPEGKDSVKTSQELLIALMRENCLFSMTETESKPIGDRPFFHLYHMHSKEAPEKLVSDLNYGGNTFLNMEKTTPVERSRCIQRALIEVAFDGLERSIQENDAEGIRQFLEILENLKLDIIDLPTEQMNLAHYLFKSLYANYSKALEETPTLFSPDDHIFRGDFGRIAFRDDAAHKIPPQFKIDVLTEAKEALKTIWF